MKVAVATEDNRGMDSTISQHFGRCPYYIIIDIEDEEIKEKGAVENPYYNSHGRTGDVPNFIKGLGADAIIAGGMGPKALGFFERFGIQTITGVSGKVEGVIKGFVKGKISGAKPCDDHELDQDGKESESEEFSRVKEEMDNLRKALSEATERLEKLKRDSKK